jgi:hypothetical protein
VTLFLPFEGDKAAEALEFIGDGGDLNVDLVLFEADGDKSCLDCHSFFIIGKAFE